MVSAFDCDLFDGTMSVHGLGQEERSILRLAALLHDIGDFVHPSSHHKQTQYIIENSDFTGLPPEHRKIVALVARFHRRAAPALRHARYASLGSEDRVRVKALASILRVADALDRGHRGKVESIEVSTKKDALQLTLVSKEDLSLETWTLERKAGLFRDVFGMKVQTKTRGAHASATAPPES
ncbi:MAG: exopolyphosphatase/guanosine-5'-triphosphate,3'-diphosphate pyrophosphatase [Polyangiales bacterium]